MRGNRWSFAVKGAFADRLVVVTVFLVVLLAASLVSAIPIYANAVAESSLRERLQRAATRETNLQAAVHLFDGGSDRRLDQRVTGIVHDAFGATPVTIARSAESEPFTLKGKTVVFGFFDGLPRHARLVAGRWPTPGTAPVSVVAQAQVARELGLDVGDVIRARSRSDADSVVAGRLVGIYQAERPSSAYWWGHPLTESGAEGPLVTSRASFFELGFQDVELHWRVEPDFRQLTIDQATELSRELALTPGRLNAGQPSGQEFLLETQLQEVLADASRSLRQARAGVLVPSIQLGLLAAYGLLVTALLLTERRLLRTESLRLRGATAGQLATIALMEATLIALPAVVLAPWAAAGVLRALNRIGPLAAIGMHLEPRVNSISYALAAAAGVVCVAGLVLPALRTRRVAVAPGRRSRPLVGLAQRVRLDIVLLVLAVLGYWQLRRYHDVLLSDLEGLGVDPIHVAAPALLLLAGALLTLRLVPLAARLAERVLVTTRGAVAALGLWQLARRPRGYASSVLLLVLAVAIGVFAATFGRTWNRAQLDQAAYAAGADVLVEPSQAIGAPSPITLASAYRALGVVEAIPVAKDSFDLERFGGSSGNLLALDAHRTGDLAHVRSDFASRPLRELLRPLADGRGSLASLPLPGRPGRLALSVRLSSEQKGPAPVAPGSPNRRSSPTLFVHLRDDDGVLYVYSLRARGQEHRFELELSRPGSNGGSAAPRYPLSLVGLELATAVPYLVPRRTTLDVSSLEVASGPDGEWRRVPLADGRWRVLVGGFKLAYERPSVEAVSTAGDAMRVTVSTGSSYTASFFGPRPSTGFRLRPGHDALPQAMPALASEGFLEAIHARVGDIVPLALSGGTQAVRIVGSYRRFPTLDPAVPSVLVDLPTYLASSFARRNLVVQPSAWWLKTSSDQSVAEQLRGTPFQSFEVVSRSERERTLLEDPAPLGVIGALTLAFIVAAAFAAVAFAASATASARSRMLEFAVLRSLGLRTSQLSGWIALENALVVALSLLAGTVLGLVVAWLVLPYEAISASGEAPVPPVQVDVPWPAVLGLELAVFGALAVIAAGEVAYVRRLRPAPILRSGERATAP